MSGFDSIIYEVEDGRARITLNRPEKLNALSLKLQSELNEALWEAESTGPSCGTRKAVWSTTEATKTTMELSSGTGSRYVSRLPE